MLLKLLGFVKLKSMFAKSLQLLGWKVVSQCKYHLINREVSCLLQGRAREGLWEQNHLSSSSFCLQTGEEENKASLLTGFNWERKWYTKDFNFRGIQNYFKSQLEDLASNKIIFLSAIFNSGQAPMPVFSLGLPHFPSKVLESFHCLYM